MAKELVSMKMTKSEMKEAAPVPADAPQYPYGLRLELNNESLEKLGLPVTAAVGKKVMVLAQAEIVSVSAYDSKEGGKNRSISLQLTHLCLESGEKEDAAKVLYKA
jgi:hypothetical protein